MRGLQIRSQIARDCKSCAALSFRDYRAMMNEVIIAKNKKVIGRLFNLDTNTYSQGALAVRTKEMLGLVASIVLGCDDCITIPPWQMPYGRNYYRADLRGFRGG